MGKVEAVRCNYDTGGYAHGGLTNTINYIGWENIKAVLPCYCGNGEYFYTIIYDANFSNTKTGGDE